MKNDLLGWFFTVERYPMVEHPEVYCRFRMFDHSGVFVYEYLCNSEPSMMAACFDLAAAGAKRIDAHSGYGQGLPREIVETHLELERMKRIDEGTTNAILDILRFKL